MGGLTTQNPTCRAGRDRASATPSRSSSGSGGGTWQGWRHTCCVLAGSQRHASPVPHWRCVQPCRSAASAFHAWHPDRADKLRRPTYGGKTRGGCGKLKGKVDSTWKIICGKLQHFREIDSIFFGLVTNVFWGGKLKIAKKKKTGQSRKWT